MPYRIPSFTVNSNKLPIKAMEGKAERNKFYCDLRWEKTRRAFLAEYPRCERCLHYNTLTLSEVVHHVVERTQCDDPYDWGNLSSQCNACHTKIHNNRRMGLPDYA